MILPPINAAAVRIVFRRTVVHHPPRNTTNPHYLRKQPNSTSTTPPNQSSNNNNDAVNNKLPNQSAGSSGNLPPPPPPPNAASASSSASANANAAANAAAAPKTIPGPSWLWLQPITGPFRAYGRAQARRPILTQLLSTIVIYAVGDLMAQYIQRPKTLEAAEEEEDRAGEPVDGEPGFAQYYSPQRTVSALIIGGFIAIPSYKWYLYLSRHFNWSSRVLSISYKVFLNQAVYTPIFNCYFFGMQGLLAGLTLREIGERIADTVPTSWNTSCKVWPAITALSFVWVPMEYRSVFAGVVAIFWQAYLSILNQRAAERELFELGALHEAEQILSTASTAAPPAPTKESAPAAVAAVAAAPAPAPAAPAAAHQRKTHHQHATPATAAA